MKCFLILLAIGLTASEKLDRTYLPPPGAQFAGGNPGDIQVPLELPNLPQTGTIQIGANGQPTQVPVTTTSYAFTQTTTYPTIESYEMTAIPINPVTGLPIHNVQADFGQNNQNLPGYYQNNGQLVPSSIPFVQPGFVPQNTQPISQGIISGGPSYVQAENQHVPSNSNEINGVSSQQPSGNEIHTQYPGGQAHNEVYNQHPAQINNGGANTQKPGTGSQSTVVNQDSRQYPTTQIIPGQQGSIQSTTSPQHVTTNNVPQEQYVEIGPKGQLNGQLPQGTYSGQPIIIQNTEKPEFNQDSQQLGNQNIINLGSTAGNNDLQPGQDYNSGSSATATPDYVSSTSAYSSVRPIIRPERPQAAGDRNAVILNYENVRSPNGYSYSYDTSNGIHGDETGTVGDGTRAQGSYSYIGDDGKVYKVVYTADENGFQPRGDHLPTPPPIPEAIQKVIEQAARDKAAGIIDDGSYDEAKYGYKNYQSPVNHRRPQPQYPGKFKNNQREEDTIIPISGITDEEYNERMPKDQNKNDISRGGTKKGPIGKYPSQGSSDNVHGGNKNAGFNNDQNLKNRYQKPIQNAERIPDNEENDTYNFDLNRPNSSSLPMPTGGIKGTELEYPKSTTQDVAGDNVNQSNEASKPSKFNNGEIMRDNYDYYNPDQPLTISGNGSPMITTQKQSSEQMVKSKTKRPQNGLTLNQGDLDDFVNKQKDVSPSTPIYGKKNVAIQAPNQETNQQIDGNGYYYNSPQTEFGQTQFPTRFKEEELPTTEPMSSKILEKGTTIRPFQTPEVYNQPSEREQNRPRYKTQQSGTLKPFMTSRVTTPGDISYSDYDSEDYYNDQDTANEDISSNKRPNDNVDKQAMTELQNVPYGQRTRVIQKGALTPSQKDDYYKTVTPGYVYEANKQSPTQSSRFGSTETPRTETMKQSQRRPTTTRRPDTATAVIRPVASSTPTVETSNSRYQTTNPRFEYPSTTVVPAYSSNGEQPSYGSRSPNRQLGITSQNYPSYTTTSSTILPTTPAYQPTSGTFVPSGTPETYQKSPIDTYPTDQQHPTNQQNEPVFTGSRPQGTTSEAFPGTYPTSTPGYYQTTSQQDPNISTASTRGPLISGRPGSVIISGSGTSSPESLPTGSYQNGYHYEAPTPGYNSILTPEGRPNFNSPIDSVSPGTYYSQTSSSPGNEYGPSGSHSATATPTTIGTTPGSFISSTTPGMPYEEYYTTQRPTYPSTQGVYGTNPLVDGFGRPIVSGQYPSYPSTGQDINQYPGFQLTNVNDFKGPGGLTSGLSSFPPGDRSRDNLRPMYGGEQSSNYPGYYGQPQVIGEDFSGPKQPQRFDPQTGYHY